MTMPKPDDTPEGLPPQGLRSSLVRLTTSGALGVGLVLVLLPAVALFFGVQMLKDNDAVGLPLLAIFGIMILFGSLALVAMLFKNLELTNPEQPLGLPEGSIRAAIALSLIVLFAIIAIMLFKTSRGEPVQLQGLTLEQRSELLPKVADRLAGERRSCSSTPAAGAACPEKDQRFELTLLSPTPTTMLDMAKQLLILVGTLMTSVTSYYFAARSASSAAAKDDKTPDAAAPKPGGGDGKPGVPGQAAAGAGGATGAAGGAEAQGADGASAADAAHEGHVDGCDVAITDVTADHELPPARGGVAQAEGG